MRPPFVVYRPDRGEGFFSNVLFVLDGIAYARVLRMTPVVDMERHPTRYRVVPGNDWERYFEQPAGVGVEGAINTPHRDNGGRRTGFFSDLYQQPLPSGFTASVYRRLVSRWVRLRPAVLEALEARAALLGLQPGAYVSVHFRGTDMRNTPDHPRPVDVEMYLDAAAAEPLLPIFLATDDGHVVQRFRERFGERLRAADVRRSASEAAVHAGSSTADLGMEVLLDALLLGRGNRLIAGRSNVAVAAILLAPSPLAVAEMTPREYGDGRALPRRSGRLVLVRRGLAATRRGTEMWFGLRHWRTSRRGA